MTLSEGIEIESCASSDLVMFSLLDWHLLRTSYMVAKNTAPVRDTLHNMVTAHQMTSSEKYAASGPMLEAFRFDIPIRNFAQNHNAFPMFPI